MRIRAAFLVVIASTAACIVSGAARAGPPVVIPPDLPEPPPPVEEAPIAVEPPPVVVPERNKVLSIAVYDLAGVGIPPRTTKLVTASLLNEVRKLVGVSVIGLDDVKAMLAHEANKQLTGCAEDSCLGDVADSLGVGIIVVGSLAEVDGEHVIEIKRIEQSQAKVTATFVKRLRPENGEEFLAVIGPAVEELFPERSVLPGRTRGVDPTIALRLNPPPLPRWSFFTVAGASAAFFVAGATASTVSALSASAADAALVKSSGELVDGSEVMGPYRTAVAATITADVLYGAGAVALAGAGVSALFVDWNGYGDAEP